MQQWEHNNYQGQLQVCKLQTGPSFAHAFRLQRLAVMERRDAGIDSEPITDSTMDSGAISRRGIQVYVGLKDQDIETRPLITLITGGRGRGLSVGAVDGQERKERAFLDTT